MQQAEDLGRLLQGLRSQLPMLSFGMFTGYSEKELETGRYFTRHDVGQDRRRALSKLITAMSPSVVWKYVSSNSAASSMARPQNRDLRLSSPVLNKVATMVLVISVPGPFGRNCDRHSTELPTPFGLTSSTPV